MIVSLEVIRLVVAITGTAAATYFDLFNRRNVPSLLLYGFLALSVLLWVPNIEGTVITLATAIIIFVVGRIFYMMGHIGEADVFVFTSLVFLLPKQPELLNARVGYLPFIFTIIVFSGILFAGYAFIKYALPIIIKIDKKKKINSKEAVGSIILLGAFSAFLYTIAQIGMFTVWYYLLFSYLLILSVVFMCLRDELKRSMMERISISKIEEGDVIATEYLKKDYIKKHKIPRVFSEKHRTRLKKEKIVSLPVYTKLPPFLPFIMLGLIVSLLVGDIFSHLITVHFIMP